MKTLGIIFSNIHDTYLGELTKQRTLASLPFGGRYRLIDFVLSNMVNSGITEVGVIAKYNYQSLMDHLSTVSNWDLDRKNGGLFILPPFGMGQSSVYGSKIDALFGALGFIKSSKQEYIIMSDTNVLCNIDYDKAVESHVKSGAEVTVIANHESSKGRSQDFVFTAENGFVTDVEINSPCTKSDFCGMGMFIMEKEKLIKVITNAIAHGYTHFERDFLQRQFMKGALKIGVYEFTGTVLRNRDVASYFKNNMRLLEEKVRSDIFSTQSPIYTKVRDDVPTHYGDECSVGDTLIANGCRIEGKVENSILFRDVVIEKGAVVKNSIIMQGSVVESGAKLDFGIIDKDCRITSGRSLVGAEVAPVIIHKGEVV